MRHPVTECSVDDCTSRGTQWSSGEPLCNKHWARWSRNGDPNKLVRLSIVPDTLMMMTNDVASRSRDECWKWEGRTDDKGYGRFGRFKAYQVVIELDGRPRPEFPTDNALHSCDNKWCWNPDHLRWGTNQENKQDYAERWGYCPHCDHCNQEREEA